jgi:hypothetical protein
VGHVAPEMMKTYGHIRRQALNQAAEALEPSAPVPASQAATPRTHRARVMSQSTSQSGRPTARVLRFVREIGSSGWIRAESRPVRPDARMPEARPGAANGSEAGVSGSSGWIRTSNPPVNRSDPEVRPGVTDDDEGDGSQ